MRKIALVLLVVCAAFPGAAGGKKDAAKPETAIGVGGSAGRYSAQSGGSGGIYVGIMEFGGDVKNITPGFVFLDPLGKQQLLDYIDNSYHPAQTPVSAFYYAVHRAITDVETAQKSLPEGTSATVIAITDGLDTGSTNPALPILPSSPTLGNVNRNNLAQYHLYLTQLLEEKQINMTSIGIAGADTMSQFPQNSSFTNRSLNESVAEIVGSMNLTASNPLLTFTISSAVYPAGTRIRIVFDGQNAANSRRYIEGKVAAGSYNLTDVTSEGISLSGQPAEIQGEIKNTEIWYTMTVSDSINKSLVRQWYIQPFAASVNGNGWLPNSESGEITITNYGLAPFKKNSAVVYLILDGSTSVEKNMEQIRRSAKNVINQLYYAVSSPAQATALALTPSHVQVPAHQLATPTPVTYNQTASGYWIEVGAYLVLENAEYARRQLSAKNFPCQITLSKVSNQVLYRVQVGPYRSEASAQHDLTAIRQSSWGFFATDLP
jgi:cell division septation protein DedD